MLILFQQTVLRCIEDAHIRSKIVEILSAKSEDPFQHLNHFHSTENLTPAWQASLASKYRFIRTIWTITNSVIQKESVDKASVCKSRTAGSSPRFWILVVQKVGCHNSWCLTYLTESYQSTSSREHAVFQGNYSRDIGTTKKYVSRF